MRRRHLLTLAGAALAAPAVQAQSGLQDVRFSLDWALAGPQAAFLLALEKGYFREAGLNVTMDRGFGSGDVPLKIASGAYDVGVADINPTIRLRLERPEFDVFTPFIIYDATALAIMTLRRENIRRPADLVGKTIAAPESDAGRQLFPAFARAAGFDPGGVRWLTVTPQLREPMLMQGRANAIAGFITSGIQSLKGLGAAEADIVTMMFNEVGADFYAHLPPHDSPLGGGEPACGHRPDPRPGQGAVRRAERHARHHRHARRREPLTTCRWRRSGSACRWNG
jgi:NitT/TauT family transport system substrate-binding protein